MKKGKKTREEILQAAFRLASVDGLSKLTLGSLAKEVGMSKSGIFAHFRSKQALQLSLLEWTSTFFIENVLTPSLKIPRGVPRIRHFFETWLNWHNRMAGPGGCIFISAASEYDDRPGAIRDFLIDQQQKLFDSIRRMVRAAVEEGHFRADTDPEQFAFQYYSLFLGYHHYKRLLEDSSAAKRLTDAFEELISSHTRCGGNQYEQHRAI